VFTNVPSGDYTFRARAVAADGSVLGQLEMPLVMVPPYWETWWFRSAMVLATLALIYAFYHIRINAIRKEARLTTAFNKRLADVELTALRAQMNPHFLFNALNSIRHHVLNSRPEEADRYLSKFARLIRLILDHSDQRTVPLADELQALRLYLELEASRFDDKFSFHIQVDPSIDASTTMIPPMLIQPYLENAIWHGLMQKSEGGELVLRIGREGDRLRIEVEDDGIGRAKAAEIKSRSALKKRSMGMSITQQRLAMIEKQQGIRCDLQVQDLVLPDGEPGGTRITLMIPHT
jgi:sensor histidine kinase YesM